MATCVSRRRRRRSRRLRASFSFRSMKAASSSESPRNCWAVPILQPFASSLRLFSSRMVVLPKPSLAGSDYPFGCRRCLLAEHFKHQDCVRVDTVDNSPGCGHVLDPQLVASRPDRGHRSRVWHSYRLALLKPTQQVPRLHPGGLGEGRSLDLPVQPGERLVPRAHGSAVYVRSDIPSTRLSPRTSTGPPSRGSPCLRCGVPSARVPRRVTLPVPSPCRAHSRALPAQGPRRSRLRVIRIVKPTWMGLCDDARSQSLSSVSSPAIVFATRHRGRPDRVLTDVVRRTTRRHNSMWRKISERRRLELGTQ